MSNLTLSSFFPDTLICCPNDLPFEDGTYEVIERGSLNFLIMKNHRIQYYIAYHLESKTRIFTWHFEYLNKDGEEIHNVWIQRSSSNKFVLFESTHGDLYPEEHKAVIEFKQNAKKCCNNPVRHNENGCTHTYCCTDRESRSEEEKILLDKIVNLESIILKLNSGKYPNFESIIFEQNA